MTYGAITLDTCILRSYGYKFDSGVLSQLKQFKDTPLRIILSEVVVREARKHISEDLQKVQGEASRALRKHANRNLFGVRDADLKKASDILNLGMDTSSLADDVLSRYIKSIGAEEIPVLGKVEVNDVLDRYFTHSTPFSKGEKCKHEFPDAFALLSIEKWAKDEKLKVLVISSDKAWISFATQSEHLEYVSKLPDALEEFQPDNDAHRYCSRLSEALNCDQDSHLKTQVLHLVDQLLECVQLEAEVAASFRLFQDPAYLTDAKIRLSEGSLVRPLLAQENDLVVQAQFTIEATAICYIEFYVHDSVDGDDIILDSTTLEQDVVIDASVMLELSGDFSFDEDVECSNAEIISIDEPVDFGHVEPFEGEHDV